ncbi:MAG: pyridoxal-phosphate dependent enzyme [Gemmatimonadaceae bacterium]|nr:pyridoxal-phosphate dependent enzyme [Gemmatimonadaceae bacterium]
MADVDLPPIIPLDAIMAARARLQGTIVRTPVVRLRHDATLPDVRLKLENLQPIGSFKLRGAGNAMRAMPRGSLGDGVWTASAGNMAQGVAWCAREMGVPCLVVVPDHAPETKVRAVERLGARIVRRPFNEWWQLLVDRGSPEFAGRFVHPVSDAEVMAGNATVALEILEDVPDVSAIVVPYGGGGLSCGIASAVRHLAPHVKVYAAEVASAAPLAPALAAGGPVPTAYAPSFVDGIGGRTVLAEMWPLAQALLAGSLVVSLEQVAAAWRLVLERNRVLAEGAGAASVAAALTGTAGDGPLVAVVSGGNIDSSVVVKLLQGELP